MTEPKKASEGGKLFDDWPERYDAWFKTPIGRLIRKYESELILDLLEPRRGEHIFDAGCGTGIFTVDMLSEGSRVVGLDISGPMLREAVRSSSDRPFQAVLGDMTALPFAENTFHRSVSVTAVEFVQDPGAALAEMFRVTRPGGVVLLATLNSRGPWAQRRMERARKGESPLFQKAVFRSAADLVSLSHLKATVRSAVHFAKETDPETAPLMEAEGRSNNSMDGAFVAALWRKPS